MTKPAAPKPAVTVVVPVHNAADAAEKLLPAWPATFERLGRPFELIVVDDGSTDATPAKLDALAARLRHTRVIRHDTRRGFGACLRSALAVAQHPLFFYTALDYPYTPMDVRVMLDRIEIKDELLGRQADLISGCRMGRKTPELVAWPGRLWRLFWRLFAGMKLEPPATWLGWRAFVYGKFVGTVFGVPLADVNSAFKLYRTAFLKRFPIQSDGDFVHAELVAKATFLTSIMDEVPLTPQSPEPAPRPSVWKEMWRVFKYPEFTHADAPPSEPGAQAPAGGAVAGTTPASGAAGSDGPPPTALSFA